MNYILVFQSVCSSASYHIESNMLSSLSEHHDLRIQMSTDLSWTIVQSVLKHLALLRRTSGKFGSVGAGDLFI